MSEMEHEETAGPSVRASSQNPRDIETAQSAIQPDKTGASQSHRYVRVSERAAVRKASFGQSESERPLFRGGFVDRFPSGRSHPGDVDVARDVLEIHDDSNSRQRHYNKRNDF